MFCSNCGYQLNSDANFCPKCGARVQSTQNIQKTDQSGIGGSEFDREAVKIHLNDILTLECIRDRLQINLEKARRTRSTLINRNCFKEYLYSESYSSKPEYVTRTYVFFFFDGNSYYYCKDTNSGLVKTMSYFACYNSTPSSRLSNIVSDILSGSCKLTQIEESDELFHFKKSILHRKPEFYQRIFEDFQQTAPGLYQKNLEEIERLAEMQNGIEQELHEVEAILKKAYQVNIIPSQFRNLYAIYYLHEFISTSHESLSTALLHYDLNEIKAKLDKIIEQQEEMIIQQAIIATQNEQLLQQNRMQLEKLSSIDANTSQAAQYAEIAAVNAEACAWIGLANYIDKKI